MYIKSLTKFNTVNKKHTLYVYIGYKPAYRSICMEPAMQHNARTVDQSWLVAHTGSGLV